MFVRNAAIVTLLALTLALPAFASGSGGPNQTPTVESCAGAGCQPVQDTTGAGLIPTTVPQRENADQAGIALFGLVVVLLVSIPVALVWQRNVRQRAVTSVDQKAEVIPYSKRS